MTSKGHVQRSPGRLQWVLSNDSPSPVSSEVCQGFLYQATNAAPFRPGRGGSLGEPCGDL
eukprot:CAMPEP_0170114776 /NCGR_PEP_ID=MMETSP0020_2-20130122/10959_1 /TAXON_ID=98059 /ORGANISM="Dinobryon sp., Strain UTEXLB2267" /LENGTH=59 /DNA_ID=CAMNT_0010341935 /DNA_START=40 /DNA_END=215 /DNA_ORIENTATION=+